MRRSDAENILEVRTRRRDYVNEIKPAEISRKKLRELFFVACNDYFMISRGMRARFMSMPSYIVMTDEELEHQLATYMPANKTFIKKKQTKKRKADAALQSPPALSEYELERQAKIKRNHLILVELGIKIIPEQQKPTPRKARGKYVRIVRDFALRRRSSRVSAKDEEDYEEEDESEDSESEFDEEDEEEEPRPKTKQVKKLKAKKQPAAKAKRPKKAREAFVVKFSEAAVKIAEEKRPEIERGQIWAVMLQRWKAWVAETSDVNVPQAIGCLGAWVNLQRKRKRGQNGKPALSKVEEEELVKAGFSFDASDARKASADETNRETADVKWAAQFELLKKYQTKHGRLPKWSEDVALYNWCQNQRQAFRGVVGDSHRITASQSEQLKALGFDFSSGPGSGSK